MIIESVSYKMTKKAGAVFSLVLKKGDIVILEGPLGAGKTAFIKGVLKGLGYNPKKVTSPSFIIAREYKCERFYVYHLDLYRIENNDDLRQIGYEDYFYRPDGITLIEWGGKAESMLNGFFKVNITPKGEKARSISFSGQGKR